MLDGQSRKMGVRREIPTGTQRRNQVTHGLEVARGRFGHGDRRMLEPGIDQVECSIHGQRLLKEPCPRRQPEKGQEDGPRQPNGFCSGNRDFEPCLCLLVVWGILVDRIDEQVDVYNDHLRKENFRPNSSSSMAVAASSALSHRKFRSPPRE